MKCLYLPECIEIDEIIRAAHEQLSCATRHLIDLESHIKKCLDSPEQYQYSNFDGALTSSAEEASLACMYAQRHIQDAYSILVCGDDDTDQQKESGCSVKQPDPRIAIMTDDGIIAIRFAVLPNARPSVYMSEERDLSVYYKPDLTAAISQFDAGHLLRLMKSPIRIQYMHVFPAKRPSERAADNDNYAYKHYTDMIVSALGRSDGSLECCFYYDTFLSDEVPSGTYVLVSLATTSLIRKDALIGLVKSSDLEMYNPFHCVPQNMQ